jgi:hypothetical protein
MASETIKLFTTLYRLANYDMRDFRRTLDTHCRTVLHTVRPRGNGTHVDFDRGSDILTYWASDSSYTDAGGSPLPLPASGPEPSLDALSKRAKLTVPLQQTIAYLTRAGCIRRRGKRYVYVRGDVLHRPDDDLVAHQMKILHLLLLNFQHNVGTKISRRMFEKSVESAPISQTSSRAFKIRNREAALAFLKGQDSDLAGLSALRRPGRGDVREVVTVFGTTLPASPSKRQFVRPGEGRGDPPPTHKKLTTAKI